MMMMMMMIVKDFVVESGMCITCIGQIYLTFTCTGVRWQWDLVCDDGYLVETSTSVFNFGVMFGAVIFTSLADRLGRKWIHLACQYSMIALGIVVAFAPNYVTFVIFRFFLGAAREVNMCNVICCSHNVSCFEFINGLSFVILRMRNDVRRSYQFNTEPSGRPN